MYNHCFPWTSVLSFSIVLLLFLYKHNIQPFKFKLIITYNYKNDFFFHYTQHVINRQYISQITKIEYDHINN